MSSDPPPAAAATTAALRTNPAIPTISQPPPDLDRQATFFVPGTPTIIPPTPGVNPQRAGPASTGPTDPITTHIIDSTTGLPAAAVRVSLTLLSPLGPSGAFNATTNESGRVTTWTPQAGPPLSEIFDNFAKHGASHERGDRMIWSLKFDTLTYWGEGKTFFPEIELKFFVGKGEAHWHVPVLLGPWGYTTYRGS
jgi:5-hydroxyisourate hydrolase